MGEKFMDRRTFLGALAGIPLAGAHPGRLDAQQDWTPNRSIKLIVPFAPGGSTDVMARLIGQAISERVGQPVVIENRTGAGGNVGAEAAARSDPDGYTLFMATSSTHATNPALYKNLRFDPVRDFTAITQTAFVPNLLVVHPDVPAKNVADLIAHGKANPGKLNYGSGGSGTSLHLAAAMFGHLAKIEMVHVPYRGGAPAATDLIAGKIQLSFSPMVEVIEHVRAGLLRPLGVTTKARSAQFPDIPTIGEHLAGYEIALWNGIVGPAGMPPAAAARYQREIAAALKTPELRDKIAGQGSDAVGSTPEEFAAFIKAELPKWAEIVRISGATAG
jgi:tripartite-type tricarboxylate transporter receptor subunit TctC